MTERVRGEDRAAICTDVAGNCCPADNRASLHIEGVRVVDADRLGLTIRGYYWKADYFNSAGGQCGEDIRIPKAPQNFKIAYTAVGTEGPPPVEATLSGPTTLDHGEWGTWEASVTGGSGSTSYNWEYRPVGYGEPWQNKSCTGSSCTHRFFNDSDLSKNGGIRVIATKGTESDTAQTTVSIAPSGGGGCPPTCTFARKRRLVLSDVRAQGRDDDTVRLSWQASGPDVPSTFVLQHRPDSTGAWARLGTVPAGDSTSIDSSRAVAYRFRTETLEIGTHQFRVGLPQDAGSTPRAVGNGETESVQRYTGPVTAEIAMDGAYRLSTYPNPAREQATVELAVKERQEVNVHLYDVLGRRVATLRSGPLPAQELRRLRLDASATGLTSGTYFLRAAGEDFAATEQITVVR